MDGPTTPVVQSFSIGNIRVAKVVESVAPTSPRFLYVDKRKEDLDPYLDWLQPQFVDAEKRILLSIHTFLLQTTHHTIVVDTCIGNDKQNLAFPDWNGRQGSYLRDLAALGCAPESVDYVVCTHMHIDHTGWIRVCKTDVGYRRFQTPSTCSTRANGSICETTRATQIRSW